MLFRSLQFLLTGGDDYELCFAAPASRHQSVLRAGARARVAVTHVGTIVKPQGKGARVQVLRASGAALDTTRMRGFDHFN